MSTSGGGCLPVLRACSRALVRFLATALLCRTRWLSLPVSTMWHTATASSAVRRSATVRKGAFELPLLANFGTG